MDERIEWTPWEIGSVDIDQDPSYAVVHGHGGSIFSGPPIVGLHPYYGSTTVMERRLIKFWIDDEGRKMAEILEIEQRVER